MEKENKNKNLKTKSTSRIVKSRYLQNAGTNNINRPTTNPVFKSPITGPSKPKASTPEREQHSTLSLDLSHISKVSDRTTSDKRMKRNSTVVSKKEKMLSVQEELEILEAERLLTMFVKAASNHEFQEEKKKFQLAYMDLMEQTVRKQQELHTVQQNLKLVKTYCQMMSVPKDHDVVIEQILSEEENIDKFNKQFNGCNLVLLKNVQELKEENKGRFEEEIDASIQELNDLKTKLNVEECQTKIKCLEMEKEFTEKVKSCEGLMTELEKLTLFAASLKIDLDETKRNTNPFE